MRHLRGFPCNPCSVVLGHPREAAAQLSLTLFFYIFPYFLFTPCWCRKGVLYLWAPLWSIIYEHQLKENCLYQLSISFTALSSWELSLAPLADTSNSPQFKGWSFKNLQVCFCLVGFVFFSLGPGSFSLPSACQLVASANRLMRNKDKTQMNWLSCFTFSNGLSNPLYHSADTSSHLVINSS